MPPLTFACLGGNHADEDWAKSAQKLVQDLHKAGVPVVIAVENINTINAEAIVQHKAQLLAELRVYEDPGLIQGTVGESIIRIAKSEYGVTLPLDPKPVILAYETDQIQFAPDALFSAIKHQMTEGDANKTRAQVMNGSMVPRIAAYESELNFYKWAANTEGVEVKGLESAESRAEADLLDPFAAEGARIEGMTENGMRMIRDQMKTGGVILATDLGIAHTAALSRALTAKVHEQLMDNGDDWSGVKIANLPALQGDSWRRTRGAMNEGISKLLVTLDTVRQDRPFYEKVAKIASSQHETIEGLVGDGQFSSGEALAPPVDLIQEECEALKQEVGVKQELKTAFELERTACKTTMQLLEINDETESQAYDIARDREEELEKLIDDLSAELDGQQGDGLRPRLETLQNQLDSGAAEFKAAQDRVLLIENMVSPQELDRVAGKLVELHRAPSHSHSSSVGASESSSSRVRASVRHDDDPGRKQRMEKKMLRMDADGDPGRQERLEAKRQKAGVGLPRSNSLPNIKISSFNQH